ncbi:hypothetical protein LAZ67_X001290 [Cordylochernes scorpioides]|uniref:CCHC-type domain-containing protein n=1 Tax=Cordylochernes scorpioides TaxID=51811 RepID=A0ABY6LSB3_9ARAC|nr:hypothetical protein LAZ67_X001290 [Cordylochernes scorpioides]
MPEHFNNRRKNYEVEKMILANRRITVREVAEDLNILIGSCHSIFINEMGRREIRTKLLNCDQKEHRMNIANEMLDSVRNDPNLLQRVITGDEAWVYGYDVDTKAQSSQFKLPHEPRPKKARQVRALCVCEESKEQHWDLQFIEKVGQLDTAPEPFNFSNPGDWPKWIRRFERFRQASGLINNPENEQVNMLVYCMGDNADDILLSCKIASDQLENYNKVIECFESHFIPRRNIIYERARFNQRCQQEGEKVNEFITALHSLAEHCNFGMLHDELIRDRIVVGVRDRALSERMQLDTDLTLVKATLMAKQLESVKEQQSSLYQQDSIDQIKKMPNHIKETKRHEPKIRQFKSNQLGGSSHGCTRCGNSNNHDWKNCPAMNSYCSKCKKKGHYAKVCRSEAINEIKSEIAFLGSVEDNSKKWIVPIKVNNRQINFKIDTGADVNVLPLQYYYQSFQRIKLEKSDKILQGPNGIPLETVGMIHVKLQNKGQHLNSKIYIVNKLKQPLLSGETSEKLNIVRMIQQLSSGGRGGQRGRLGSGDNRGCYNCGEEGHRKFECTKPARGGGRGRVQSRDGGSNNTCYNCGEVGHRKYECTNNTAEDGGQEENQRKSKKACYTCGEFGHKKDDCPKSGTQES